MAGSPITLFLRNIIRYNRRSAPMRLLARAAEKYLRAWNNEGVFEFEHDGERFLLESYGKYRGERPTVVWDVGANNGAWAEMTHGLIAGAQVHSFEILPPIAAAYRERLGTRRWAHLHEIGLSESASSVEVSWLPDSDQESGITLRRDAGVGGEIKRVECPVSTVDEQIASGLPAPHFLKIDTEGHEGAVLRGAMSLLESDIAPELIQFEYGHTWIPPRETLEAVQPILEQCGYRVGRLYPRHVEFKSYAYADDHFRMGNIVAVRSDALAKLLSPRR